MMQASTPTMCTATNGRISARARHWTAPKPMMATTRATPKGYLCDEHNYYITPTYADEGWYVEKTAFEG